MVFKIKSLLPSETSVIGLLFSVSKDQNEYEIEYFLGMSPYTTYITAYEPKYARPIGKTLYEIREGNPIMAIKKFLDDHYNVKFEEKIIVDQLTETIYGKRILSGKRRKYSFEYLKNAFTSLIKFCKSNDEVKKHISFFKDINTHIPLRLDMHVVCIEINELLNSIISNYHLVTCIDNIWSLTCEIHDTVISRDFESKLSAYNELVHIHDNILKNLTQ